MVIGPRLCTGTPILKGPESHSFQKLSESGLENNLGLFVGGFIISKNEKLVSEHSLLYVHLFCSLAAQLPSEPMRSSLFSSPRFFEVWKTRGFFLGVDIKDYPIYGNPIWEFVTNWIPLELWVSEDYRGL